METMLPTGDVARDLGVSRQHVVDMCERGDLRCVRVGTHRRIPHSEVAGLVGDRSLTREQEKSLWLHQAILSLLLADPENLVATARANIRRWREEHRSDGMSRCYLDRWDEILASGLDAVIDTLHDTSPAGCELRANSPCAGVLPDETRRRLLRSFADHREREHESVGVR